MFFSQKYNYLVFLYFLNSERLKLLTYQVADLRTEVKKKEEFNALLKSRLEDLRKRIPTFGKLPQVVKTLSHLPSERPSLMNLQECKDHFLVSLTYTIIKLHSEEDMYVQDVEQANQGFLTFRERQEAFINETARLNNRSRLLPDESGEQPDTFVGPEGIKFLRDALGFHPPPEPEKYPETYHGTTAVVDGASVLMW